MVCSLDTKAFSSYPFANSLLKPSPTSTRCSLSLLALLVQKSTTTDTCFPLRELELTHERTREPVAYIHKRGGTILGSSREYEAFSF